MTTRKGMYLLMFIIFAICTTISVIFTVYFYYRFYFLEGNIFALLVMGLLGVLIYFIFFGMSIIFGILTLIFGILYLRVYLKEKGTKVVTEW